MHRLLLLVLLLGCPTEEEPPPEPQLCDGIETVSGTSVELVEWVTGVASPVHLTHAGDGTRRVFVVEQGGRIQAITQGGTVSEYLDISDRVHHLQERGLLSVAFHPDFANNGRLFVYYTNPAPAGTTTVSQFRVTGDPLTDTPDPESEIVLLTQEQPAANHNGGQLAFGPDGYLYIGLGDGGGAGDTYGNGQNPDTFLAKLLRIDIDGDAPYAIPADNPFVDDAAHRPETWAWGLRNPWRFSFDRVTGDLWLADVGQSDREEINVIDKGGNYGWSEVEGEICYSANCDLSDFDAPVWTYGRGVGISITGGFAYRGCKMPDLHGVYFYSDYNYFNSPLFSLNWDGSVATEGPVYIEQTNSFVSSFGEDEFGELYVLDHSLGRVLKLSPG